MRQCLGGVFWVREHLRPAPGAAAQIDVLHRRRVIVTGSDGSGRRRRRGRLSVAGLARTLLMSPASRERRSGRTGTVGRGFRGEERKKERKNAVLVNGSTCRSVLEQTGSRSKKKKKKCNSFISKRTVYWVQPLILQERDWTQFQPGAGLHWWSPSPPPASGHWHSRATVIRR